jgi:hypothetical protein
LNLSFFLLVHMHVLGWITNLLFVAADSTHSVESDQLSEEEEEGVTRAAQVTTSQRSPDTEGNKGTLCRACKDGNGQHGKERTRHHRHPQRGLSERRGPRAKLQPQRASHTDKRASTHSKPNTHPHVPGATTSEHSVEGRLQLCCDTRPQDRCPACRSGTFCKPGCPEPARPSICTGSKLQHCPLKPGPRPLHGPCLCPAAPAAAHQHWSADPADCC